MGPLCNGDLDRPIKWEIFDCDSGGKNESMGFVQNSVRQFISNPGNPFNVIEPDKKAKDKKYVNSGTLSVLPTCYIEHNPTFAEFVEGGCELAWEVAIDFTASNGDPMMPSSLHYCDPAGILVNQYQLAIRSVGGIIDNYDTDKKYPVYGFGARIDGNIQHCFSVSDEATGVAGIEEAYMQSVKNPNIALSGKIIISIYFTDQNSHN